MNDGTYTVEITMTGGTGKAYINSPVTVTAANGQMTARLEWSSKNYDLMIVDGKEFFPVNETGNSVFERADNMMYENKKWLKGGEEPR